jgi:hypothetical protein
MTPPVLSEAEHFSSFRLFFSDVALPMLLQERYDLNGAQAASTVPLKVP